MLNFLWAGMIGVGIIYGAFTGRMEAVTNAALDSSKEAVSLCITMVGVMSLWMGLMEIASRAGILEHLSVALRPVIRFLFPHIPKEHRANEYITTNFIANMLGLGWAATPAGLRAMEELENLERDRNYPLKQGTASDEMCTFLIINISSLQLIPINMIAYRSQFGSVNPAAIVGLTLAATTISTVVGIICAKCFQKK